MSRLKAQRPHDPTEPEYARLLAVLNEAERHLLTTLPGLLIDRIDIADRVLGFGDPGQAEPSLEEAQTYLDQLTALARDADERLAAVPSVS